MVRAVGQDVTGFAVGDEVFGSVAPGSGGYAEYTLTSGDPGTAEELGGHMIERDRTSRVLDLVAALVAGQKLDPQVEDVIDFDNAADALAAVEKGHSRGKVVLRVS